MLYRIHYTAMTTAGWLGGVHHAHLEESPDDAGIERLRIDITTKLRKELIEKGITLAPGQKQVVVTAVFSGDDQEYA